MTAATATDAELVVWAQQGDLDAFGVLYERHFDRVHDYVFRLARDPMLAADVTRDTFLRAMQQVGQLDDPSRFRVWLFTIARTLAVNQIEAEQQAGLGADRPTGDDPTELEVLVDLDLAEDRDGPLELEDIAALVWDATADLDEPAYTVLDLTARHNMTSSELGDVTGVESANTAVAVKALMDRATERITTYLVMRRGAKACQQLNDIVGDRTSPPDSHLHAKARRHISSCDICSRTKRELASPSDALAALATIAAPEIVYARTWDNIAKHWKTTPAQPEKRSPAWRASMVGFALVLIAGLGVAGAVQVNNAEPEATGETPTDADNGFTVDEGEAVLVVTSSTTTTSTLATTTTTELVTTTTVASTPPPGPIPTTSTTLPATTTTTAPATTTTTAANQAPTITISAPGEGEHFKSSKALQVTLIAVVSDDIDSGLTAEWFEGSTSLGSGNTLTVTFSAGCPAAVSHTVVATVTDSSGLSRSDTVTFTIGCQPKV